MESLTWTLTDRPDIKNVQIWMDGKRLNEMPVDGTPLDHPLTRAVGINLEVGQGATPLDSSPVTVYFSSSSPAGVQYYVPVTRLVNPEKDRISRAASIDSRAANEGRITGSDDRGDGAKINRTFQRQRNYGVTLG